MSLTRAAAMATRTKPHDLSTPRRVSASLPVTGTCIICSAQILRSLQTSLESLSAAPILAGWIDAGSLPSNANCYPDHTSDLPRLGSLPDLPLLTSRFNLRCAVACVPTSFVPSIRAAARNTGLDLRFIPTLEELLVSPPPQGPETEESRANAAPARPETTTTYSASPTIDLASLIARHPYSIDTTAVSAILTGKRILITGAGGSIGSELARVAASFAPESIILMERAENSLFEIDRQIARRFPAVARKAVLHDVVDEESTLRLLGSLRPHVVFHAAAHKHVPLMEDHPGHAITNNLFGTKSIADAAVACGAERFVMISSDKAVNPTSVMGATKRMAEMYVRGLGARSSSTRLSMVRFGNVLGSACSVLTIWSTQIAEALAGGGPLTITDPRMTRYFMTIPEAATLVIQSMVVGASPSATTRGDSRAVVTGRPSGPHPVGVYVLDMGQPIRILELAARFIRAHGATPRVDPTSAAKLFGPDIAAQITADFPLPAADDPRPIVDVVFTGARPGEKIHEELAYAAEMLAPTSHPGVQSWAGPGFSDADAARVQSMVSQMSTIRFTQDRAAIIEAIRHHVPEMRRN